MAATEKIRVRWAGQIREVIVLKRFKNGKIRVQVTRAQNFGGRPGSLGRPENVTIEPWQVVKDES